MKHIEMIIDYITDGTDFQYNDNHGVLVRCKDCKFKFLDDMVWNCPFGLPGGENFFCGYGAKDGDTE